RRKRKKKEEEEDPALKGYQVNNVGITSYTFSQGRLQIEASLPGGVETNSTLMEKGER
ncbi:unnamed protein product, partial [Candidula unifasciata]